jgi:filamentous hemagglutinin family protein
MIDLSVGSALRCGVSTRAMVLALTAPLVVAAPLSCARAGALPANGSYVTGSGTIAKKGTTGLTINQSSSTGIINWKTFSIGQGNAVQFNNGKGATLNKVTGGDPSTIAGSLKATGSIYLINPEGVIVSKTGKVLTTGSFVASTRSISNNDFMSGDYQFTGTSKTNVSNAGSITSTNGNVALIGSSVANSGTIIAEHGSASLDAGNNILLKPAGSPVLVSGGSGSVTNSGTIVSAQAQLDAAGGNVYALSGNNGGVIRATGTSTINGHIWLTSGTGNVTTSGTIAASNANGSGGAVDITGANITTQGRIDASATKTGQSGGSIHIVSNMKSGTTKVGGSITAEGSGLGHGGKMETSGHVLQLGAAKVSAGQGGQWLLDPDDLTIDATAATALEDALNSGSDVELSTSSGTATGGYGNATNGEGDIIIDAPVTWTSSAKLTLDAYNDIDIDALVTITNSAGKLILTTGDTGNDHQHDNTSASLNFFGGRVAFTGTSSGSGSNLKIDGNFYTLENDVADLAAGVSGNASGDYALANNYDASSDPTNMHFAVGNFSGTFEGLGNAISNVKVSSTSGSTAGFFNDISGTVRDFGLVNVTVTSSAASAVVGGLTAENDGTIENSYVTGTVSDSASGSSVGGLVGLNEGATIEQSHASVSVTGGGSGTGGLVGWNHNAGEIIQSYATGSVAGGTDVGGLVGDDDPNGNSGNEILSSYATGDVSSGTEMGGLVGYNGGTVQFSYATGAVSGSGTEIGGLVGYNAGTIKADYATGDVSSSANSAEAGGLVGFNNNGAKIDESYETGAATASGNSAEAGGLIGQNNNISVGSSYYDYYNSTANSSAFGNTSSGSVTGIALSAMNSTSSFSHWTFGGLGSGDDWVIIDTDGTLNNASGVTGGTLPMLVGEYSTTITNAHQLQLMALDLTATYRLANDIDASGTAGGDVWESQGFISVGGDTLTSTAFTGTFDGAGHTIANLTIDDTTNRHVGLFGDASGATIENVGLTGETVTSTIDYADVGGLAGIATGTIAGSYITGTVGGANYGDVGGLVGLNSGAAITNSYATSGVTSGDGSNAGGLVGYLSSGTITRSYATGTVSNGSYGYAGGLVGYLNSGTITGSYATGSVTGVGQEDIGGLVGYSDGTIEASYATGLVTGTASDIGGLLGESDANGTVENSYASGSVMGGDNATAGGLLGQNDSGATVENSYAAGSVSGGAASDVGGLVGYNDGAIETSYSIGTVTGAHVGGLVGYFDDGSVTNSYFDTSTSGIAASQGTSNVLNEVGITGYTTSAFQSKSLTDLGFNSSIWSQVTGSFPYLSWQFANGVTPVVIAGTIVDPSGVAQGSGIDVSIYAGGAQTAALQTFADGTFYALSAPIDGGVAAISGADGLAFEDNGTAANLRIETDASSLSTSDASLSLLGTALSATLGSTPYGSFTTVQDLKNSVGGSVIINTSANFDFDQSLDLSGKFLTLNGTGDVTQSDGAISARGLSGSKTSGNLTLNGANQITTLSPMLIEDGNLTLVDTTALDVDDVSADNISLTAGGLITLEDSIDAGKVVLNTTGGIEGGDFNVASISGSAKGAVQLVGNISQLGSFTTGGNAFSLTDEESLTVTGAVNAGAGSLTLTTKNAGDKITLDAALTGGTVKLTSVSTITSDSAGKVSAATLTGSSKGATSLTAANVITNLSTFTTGGNYALSLTDAHALAVTGAVTTGSGALTLTTTGAGHGITITKTLASTGTVKLTSAAGITENATTGKITAKVLTGSSKGATSLTAANAITELSSFSTGGNYAFALKDAHALTQVGALTAGTAALALATTGSTSSMILDGSITGGAVTLSSGAAISQSTTVGKITAKTLKVTSHGSAVLTGLNAVTSLIGLANTGTGNAEFANSKALAVTGPVSTTASTAIVLLDARAGNLTLESTVKGGTVDLESAAGETLQTAKSVITANTVLNVWTKTGYDLIGKNKIKKVGTHTRKSGPAVIDGVE